MRFLTSSESSWRSEHRCRLGHCWPLSAADTFPGGREPLRLIFRAHCRLLRRSSGCSAGSLLLPVWRLWVLPPPGLARAPQGPLSSHVSSHSPMFTKTWDWVGGGRGLGPGRLGRPGAYRPFHSSPEWCGACAQTTPLWTCPGMKSLPARVGDRAPRHLSLHLQVGAISLAVPALGHCAWFDGQLGAGVNTWGPHWAAP